MQDKNKKNILKIIILISISIAIISFFIPMISFDYSDVLKDMGYEPKLYTKREDSFLFNHISGYDHRDDKPYSEYHRYVFLYFIEFEEGNKDLKDKFFTVTDYDVENPILSKGMANVIDISMMLIFFPMFIIFSYLIIRKLNNIKLRNLLYLSIIMFIIIISTISIVYYLYDFIDIDNLGYVNYLNFGHGFYLACASIILLFAAILIQHIFKKNKKLKSYRKVSKSTT